MIVVWSECRAIRFSGCKKRGIHRPCDWGATKPLGGFLAVPPERWTIGEALVIDEAARVLADSNVTPALPSAVATACPWWLRFGFPLAYRSDLVERVGVLLRANAVTGQRTLNAIECILSKRDSQVFWTLERSAGNM